MAQWMCPNCGPRRDDQITDDGPVPLCRCGLMPLVRRKGTWVEPSPESCPQGHQLGPDRMLLGWQSCLCTTAVRNHGGHRTWRCRECEAVITAPPCMEPMEPHRRREEAPPTP